MILKICTGNGWRFISDVSEVEVNPSTKDVDTDYPCQNIFVNDKERYIKVIKYFINHKGDTRDLANWIKIDDVKVYLLNDEGKTVERLN